MFFFLQASRYFTVIFLAACWMLRCGAFRDLAPFVQFKKREKHPWRSVDFSKVAGPSLICFSYFCWNPANTYVSNLKAFYLAETESRLEKSDRTHMALF